MSHQSANTPKATSGPPRSIGLYIHVKGDIVINVDEVVINNQACTHGDPGKNSDGHHDGLAKDAPSRVDAAKSTTAHSVDDDANDEPAAEVHNDHNISIGFCPHEEDDDDDDARNASDTSLSSSSTFYPIPTPARNFNCRLGNCTLAFPSNQQRVDHEVWTHFLCGRCGTEYASLDVATTVRQD